MENLWLIIFKEQQKEPIVTTRLLNIYLTSWKHCLFAFIRINSLKVQWKISTYTLTRWFEGYLINSVILVIKAIGKNLGIISHEFQMPIFLYFEINLFLWVSLSWKVNVYTVYTVINNSTVIAYPIWCCDLCFTFVCFVVLSPAIHMSFVCWQTETWQWSLTKVVSSV